MKQLLAMAASAVLLTACGTTSGLHDTLPKLSSHSTKDVATYVQCVKDKWTAITPDTRASSKDQSGSVVASDKADARELIEVTADGTSSLVTMYETQSPPKKDPKQSYYNPAYRDAAVSCL